MNKKLILAVLVAVLAPVVWLGSSGSPGWGDHNPGLGQKLAGGWLVNGVVGGQPAEVMFSIGADGGVIINDTLRWWDEETGGWLNTRANTTAHGSWRCTGPNRIAMTTLLFIQDPSGNTVLYEKIAAELTLQKQSGRLEGTAVVQLIWPDTDPLNPEQDKIMVTLPGTMTGRPIR